jgi:hypothetical protein
LKSLPHLKCLPPLPTVSEGSFSTRGGERLVEGLG